MMQASAQPIVSPQRAAPRKLQSIEELDREIGIRRGKLLRSNAVREECEFRLAGTRRKRAELDEEVRRLDRELASENRAVFMLSHELDGLLQIRERINRRAAELAQAAGSKTAPSVENRRERSRQPLTLSVGFEGETNFYVGFSEDISEGGLFVATHHTRAIGERFLVSFRLPTQDRPIRCVAEVSWVREYRDNRQVNEGPPGMGLRFVGLIPEDGDAIASFMKEREPLFHPGMDDLD